MERGLGKLGEHNAGPLCWATENLSVSALQINSVKEQTAASNGGRQETVPPPSRSLESEDFDSVDDGCRCATGIWHAMLFIVSRRRLGRTEGEPKSTTGAAEDRP